MKINDFRRVFKMTNGFYITDDVIMFRKPLEFWDQKTNESVKYKSLDEALNHKIGGKTAREIIETLDVLYIEPATA